MAVESRPMRRRRSPEHHHAQEGDGHDLLVRPERPHGLEGPARGRAGASGVEVTSGRMTL